MNLFLPFGIHIQPELLETAATFENCVKTVKLIKNDKYSTNLSPTKKSVAGELHSGGAEIKSCHNKLCKKRKERKRDENQNF